MNDLQVFPALDEATEAALRHSIQRFGVVVPIVVDGHGRIIDGNHRARIAKELGVQCPQTKRVVKNDDDARTLGVSLNNDRRHMSKEQRQEIVVQLHRDGHSTRAIAGAVGVGQTQVRRDLTQVSPDGSPEDDGDTGDQPDQVTGLDGKSYPATNNTDPRHQRKLKRQEQVRTLHAEGLSVTEIAKQLGVHSSTISTDFNELNLTRAHDASRAGALERRKRLCQLAAEGNTSRQIADALRISEGGVKNIARELGVEIIADRHVGGTRRHDSTRIVEQIVMAAENVTAGADLIDFEELDVTRIDDWASSLERALWSIRKFKNQLKELTHE